MKRIAWIVNLLLASWLTGCGWMDGPQTEPPPDHRHTALPGRVSLADPEATRAALLEQYLDWAGVPYRIGGRSREWVIYERELSAHGEVVVCTDDGSYGRSGFVTEALRDALAEGGVDAVYAVGPVPMMRAVVEMTRPLGIHTIVSLNPIMVDGTGMCGGCRVTVGGEPRYACVDGPEFDGHLVDFDELKDRLTTYRDFESAESERTNHDCKLGS